MSTRTQDGQGTPAQSASKMSLAKVPATCVQDVCIGYIQDVLVFETLRIIVKPMAVSVPPVLRHHSYVHLHHRLVPPTMSDKTFNILQWNANGIGNKQTELSIFLEAYNVKVAAIQESKLTAKSRSPNIQYYTLVRQDRRQGPCGGLLFLIHNSVSFTRKPLSTTSKNDPHLEELTISIAMGNTELLITNMYIPPASSCNGRYSPPIDHLLLLLLVVSLHFSHPL